MKLIGMETSDYNETRYIQCETMEEYNDVLKREKSKHGIKMVQMLPLTFTKHQILQKLQEKSLIQTLKLKSTILAQNFVNSMQNHLQIQK